MSKNNTEINLKRTLESIDNIQLTDDALGSLPVSFGEPIFIDNNGTRDISESCKAYIAVGSSNLNEEIFRNAIIFKGFWDKNQGDSLVFFNENNTGIVKENGEPVYVDRVTTGQVELNTTDSTKYYILCQADVPRDSTDVEDRNGKVVKFNMNDSGIYITRNGVMHGAAWNDYAEKRLVLVDKDNPELTEPGSVVCENGDGSLSPSTERLQPCAYVISDTYGMVIGEDADIPVGVSGKVLVKVDSVVKVGDCLCSGKNGFASVMTRNEVINFPDRILGIVTEIPTYEEWNDIKINNRVWMKIK